MAMTNEDKCELIREVKKGLKLGLSKKEGVEKILKNHSWWKKTTIQNYWNAFKEFGDGKG